MSSAPLSSPARLADEVGAPLCSLPSPEESPGAGPSLYVKTGFVRFYGVQLPVRMVVIALGFAAADRPLLVYSPIALDPQLQEALRALGRVRFVLAPNKIHNVFVPQFEQAYPEARIYLAPGLHERCPHLRCDGVVDAQTARRGLPFAIDGLLDVIVTQGNGFFSEILLFHQPSKTLVVCDFIENFCVGDLSSADSAPWRTRVMSWFVDAVGEPICSPEHSMMCVDPEAFARTRDHLLSLKPLRIVMAHGYIIDGEEPCRRAIQGATDRVLQKANARWSVTKALYRLVSRFA